MGFIGCMGRTSSLNGSSDIGCGTGGCPIISTGIASQQLEPQGLHRFGLQKAKKWARLFVQHDLQDDFTSQLAVQLWQDEPQLGAQGE